MLVVLLGLGTWQVRRLHWKETVLAQIARAENQPPVPLAAEPPPFAKIVAEGTLRGDLRALYGAEVRDTPAGPKMGAHLIVPLERADRPTLLVDLGWIPLSPATALNPSSGHVTVTGFVHPPEAARWFNATDNSAERHFYTLDPAAMAAALRLSAVEPFVLVALGQTQAASWPEPAHRLPRPPNNHLAYVVTWYGLAGALGIIFVVYVRKAISDA